MESRRKRRYTHTPVTARKLNEKPDTKPKQSEKSFPMGFLFSVFSLQCENGRKSELAVGKTFVIMQAVLSLNFPTIPTSCPSHQTISPASLIW